MLQQRLTESSASFLDHIESWYEALPAASLDQVIGSDPSRVAVFCVDVIVGFCVQGALASERVNTIVAPIAELFVAAHERGVRHFILPQDTHEPDAVEFAQFAPHCVRGTVESDTVPELLALPFASRYTIIPKNSIGAFVGTSLSTWMSEHPEIDTCIVVGDCSDLCTYQLSMHLRLDANARQLERRVLLVENCVQTYDLPVDVAQSIDAVPHPGDFYHVVFLHHMAQNGVEVVSSLTV